MNRETLEDKLSDLSKNVTKLGDLIQNTVNSAIEAFIIGDPGLAQKIIDNYNRANYFDITMEKECIYIQVRYQPVEGDLRFIESVFLIVMYLDRIGDIAVSIAKLVKRLFSPEKRPIKKELMDIIIEIGNISKKILEKSLEAFKRKDAKLVLKLGQMDMIINDLKKALYQKLYSSHSQNEYYLKLASDITLMVRYLERVVYNSVKIGKGVIYSINGDFKVINSEV